MSTKLGIIGGSGIGNLSLFQDWVYRTFKTPYGDAMVSEGEISGLPVVFLPRHGPTHSVPPHKINYRANISSLKSLGVKSVVAISAVGSVDSDLKPGAFTTVSDFIDFTKSRISTFFDGGSDGVVHTDFTNPYCEQISEALARGCEDNGIHIQRKCVYLCVDGPRYETPAEIRMFKQWGADVVGMTGVPEVTLAREMGLCYGSLAVVTNYAAGVSPTPLSHDEVLAVMGSVETRIAAVIAHTSKMLASMPPCISCKKPSTSL